jgi:hypothetical protein
MCIIEFRFSSGIEMYITFWPQNINEYPGIPKNTDRILLKQILKSYKAMVINDE